MTRSRTIALLAATWSAGSPEESALVARSRALLGHQPRCLRPLIREFLRSNPGPDRVPEAHIRDFLNGSDRFARAWMKGQVYPAGEWVWESEFLPAAGAARGWDLPVLTDLGETAGWLGLDTGQLPWLVRPGENGHYHCRWIPKRRGGHRLLEAPKPLLKRTQRRLLDGLLHAIPLHESCHGFRPGSSIREFITPHLAREVVLRIDLADCFPSVTAGRIFRIFLCAGYPDPVARCLTRLTTHAPPRPVLQAAPTHAQRERLRIPHLPQGAPTSPTLANLAAFRLDCRLAGIARSAGAGYGRYADDLLFSGDRDFARGIDGFLQAVTGIVLEEGFVPNHRKTRIMRSSQRQRAAGVILNEKPNLDRREWDRLKAILHNARLHGLESQNRTGHPAFRAHLDGRISWVESLNPERGAKLRALFRMIGE